VKGEKRIIQHVTFDPDGSLQIGTYDPDTDITKSGIVSMSTLLVPAGNEYDDEIAAVTDALKYLVADVLDDFPRLPKLGDKEEEG
jgi:hypothetical protein